MPKHVKTHRAKLARPHFGLLEGGLAVLLFAFCTRALSDPDFGWHLRSGMDLLRNLAIPRVDPYSYTAPTWPWVNHEWLADGIMAAIYQTLGPLALTFLFALLIGGAFMLAASLTKMELKYKLLASFLAVLAAFPILGVRMQMITLLGMATLLWLLYRYRDGQLKHLWWVIPLFLVWANLHGGFIIGFAIIAVWLTGEGVKYLFGRIWPKLYARLKITEPVFRPVQFGHLILVGLGSALATLINPYGWGLYYDFYKLFTNPLAIKSISEWQPVVLTNLTAQNYVVYASLLILLLLLTYRRIEPTRWLLIITFFCISLLYWRNLPFFMVISVGFLAEIIYEHTHIVFEQTFKNRWVILITVGLVIMAVSQRMLNVIPQTLDLTNTFRAGGYPIDAINWAKKNPDKIGTKMFNNYGHGGFLIWQFPEQKVFIDGRMPYWTNQDNRLLFADEQQSMSAQPGSIEFMARYYGVDWVIAPVGRPLDLALSGQTAWVPVYRDRVTAIYRQKSTPTAIAP
ncbi:hypothetical protein A3K24_01150 [candidate division Kazan bacterium RIFCSPHIGHO2_01_FULL_44_14]|uniref:Glycosyltransferase RgtA/B/C/D-like domain-containing protein n=1 Tax=candidate division Kazan bacterium RIFCSPLOWO2_01_FULL_45_19 TaxID=1798538 RepID=A0A1F4NPR7_UNCK3|nr:hypothetical protein [uncultured bacterium]OGB73453.1 MAG: hypothetical protein A3K51_01150 [candidate division Kazan bacterium RIFCSPLOWO2_01_FULL_45_19]OGB77698.1 MAG: hypothetical protein A3K24_01150 [candidate division Kazan bacterium RIFCSPHIGHO2_01_FULL_44_14]